MTAFNFDMSSSPAISAETSTTLILPPGRGVSDRAVSPALSFEIEN